MGEMSLFMVYHNSFGEVVDELSKWLIDRCKAYFLVLFFDNIVLSPT